MGEPLATGAPLLTMERHRRLTPAALRGALSPAMRADAAHDWFHVERVFRNGLRIAATEPSVDRLVLRGALLLHDLGEKQVRGGNALVTFPQVHALLAPFGVLAEESRAIQRAINEHSHSRGVSPSTLESAILQDADRLDALGAIGIARAFAYGGAHGRPLYDPEDRTSTLHHFYDKLLHLKEGMHTAEGSRLALQRHHLMIDFVAQFYDEWASNL